jgi:hypothetical protein
MVASQGRPAQAREAIQQRIADVHGAGQLANLMEDAGYRCCANPDDIHKYLGKFEPLQEGTVAQVLAMMARTMKGLDNGIQPGDQVIHASFAAML